MKIKKLLKEYGFEKNVHDNYVTNDISEVYSIDFFDVVGDHSFDCATIDVAKFGDGYYFVYCSSLAENLSEIISKEQFDKIIKATTILSSSQIKLSFLRKYDVVDDKLNEYFYYGFAISQEIDLDGEYLGVDEFIRTATVFQSLVEIVMENGNADFLDKLIAKCS